jgi:hypothetical protein
MITRYIPILLVCFTASCDQAKKIAAEATSKLKSSTAEKVAEEPDPELLKLVDQTEEGVIFRKDLPFPKYVQVDVTSSQNLNLRMFENSEIERKSSAITHLIETTANIELLGDHLRYTPGAFRTSDPTVKDDKGKVQIVERLAGSEPVRNFYRTDGKWQAQKGGDFLVASKAKEIAPYLDILLKEHALVPRPQWFSKRRMKIGDEIPLTGDILSMVFAGNAKGNLKLKLESIGAVAGHPCGVFNVTGSITRQKHPSFENGLIDEDLTIESGKAWLSLLHPIVLKWEYDSVITGRSGGGGGQEIRKQGTAQIKVMLEWKELKQGH